MTDNVGTFWSRDDGNIAIGTKPSGIRERPNTASGEFPKGSIPSQTDPRVGSNCCGSEHVVERGGGRIDNKPIVNSANRDPINGMKSNSVIAFCA